MRDKIEKLTGKKRSPHWGAFKKEYAKKYPKQCEICGDKRANLHHRIPFHIDPSKELDPTNMAWLCSGKGTLEHHRGVGHLGNFKSWNVRLITDIKVWFKKFNTRPFLKKKS